MHRFESQPAFILHARPYRETSRLLELFTPDYGRIGAVANGVKKSLKTGGLLQPFVGLLVSCVGRGELLTLTGHEQNGVLPILKGRRLVSGFYLNELLMRLLHRSDCDPELFKAYQQAITNLAQLPPDENEQSILRLFEKTLLKTLGYGLQLSKDAISGEKIDPDKFYLYDPEQGPMLVDNAKTDAYGGKSLLALATGKLQTGSALDDIKILSDIKRLIRQALLPHLGTKPIESRKLL